MATNYTSPCFVGVIFGFRMIYVTIPIAVIIAIKSVFIIITAYRTNTIGTYNKYFASSLAATDLILGLAYVCVGDSEYLIVTLGLSQPKYFESFLVGAWYSSVILNLAHFGVIALESYIHIAHPFFYMTAMTNRSIYIVLFCLWTSGLFYMFIPLLIYTDDHYHETCILLHPPLEYYCIGAFVFLVSGITVLVSNFKIAFLAFRNKQALLARRLRMHSASNKVAFRDNFTAAVRSVKFFSVMFGIYLICTSPSAVCVGLNILFPVPTFIYLPAIYLVPVNSVLAVIVWFFTNNVFSRAVKQTFSDVITCLCKGQMFPKSCCKVLK